MPNDNPPDSVVEHPNCHYTVNWRHPSVCTGHKTPPGSCTRPAPPAPPPAVCETCLPKWKPTWDMMRSTVLYTCNNTGMHDVEEAVKYSSSTTVSNRTLCGKTLMISYCAGSNAKDIWCNQKPMNSEELLTKQAEVCRKTLLSCFDLRPDGPRCRPWNSRRATTRVGVPKHHQGLELVSSHCEWLGSDHSKLTR